MQAQSNFFHIILFAHILAFSELHSVSYYYTKTIHTYIRYGVWYLKQKIPGRWAAKDTDWRSSCTFFRIYKWASSRMNGSTACQWDRGPCSTSRQTSRAGRTRGSRSRAPGRRGRRRSRAGGACRGAIPGMSALTRRENTHSPRVTILFSLKKDSPTFLLKNMGRMQVYYYFRKIQLNHYLNSEPLRAWALEYMNEIPTIYSYAWNMKFTFLYRWDLQEERKAEGLCQDPHDVDAFWYLLKVLLVPMHPIGWLNCRGWGPLGIFIPLFALNIEDKEREI